MLASSSASAGQVHFCRKRAQVAHDGRSPEHLLFLRRHGSHAWRVRLSTGRGVRSSGDCRSVVVVVVVPSSWAASPFIAKCGPDRGLSSEGDCLPRECPGRSRCRRSVSGEAWWPGQRREVCGGVRQGPEAEAEAEAAPQGTGPTVSAPRSAGDETNLRAEENARGRNTSSTTASQLVVWYTWQYCCLQTLLRCTGNGVRYCTLLVSPRCAATCNQTLRFRRVSAISVYSWTQHVQYSPWTQPQLWFLTCPI